MYKVIKMKKLLIVNVLLILFVARVTAQDYKYEIGVAAGLGFYMGDANQSALYYKPDAAYGVVFRRNLNYRWAIKADLITGRVRGDTRNFKNALPNGVQYNFSRQLIDLGAQAEFNFFNYGIGQSYLGTNRFAPYLIAGLGFSYAPYSRSSFFSVNIPLGVGVKYKLAPRWNIGLEFTMRKTFGDKLDGKVLEDPYGIKSSVLKNTDWYSCTLFTVTYDFGLKKKICNNL